MFLFHNAPDTMLTRIITKVGEEAMLYAVVRDAEGRSHLIPPNEAWEVLPQISMDVDKGGAATQNTLQSEYVARQLCQEGQFYGLVPVPEIRDGRSIRFDVDTAAAHSRQVR